MLITLDGIFSDTAGDKEAFPQPMSFVRGESGEIRVTVTRRDGMPFAPVLGEYVLEIRRRTGEHIFKRAGGAIPAYGDGVVVFTLSAIDTTNLLAGSYVYDIWMLYGEANAIVPLSELIVGESLRDQPALVTPSPPIPLPPYAITGPTGPAGPPGPGGALQIAGSQNAGPLLVPGDLAEHVILPAFPFVLGAGASSVAIDISATFVTSAAAVNPQEYKVTFFVDGFPAGSSGGSIMPGAGNRWSVVFGGGAATLPVGAHTLDVRVESTIDLQLNGGVGPFNATAGVLARVMWTE